MGLLDAHLEQIELCSATIADLPFPKPKQFTNAILRTRDITALIRDTEIHERALYTLNSPELKSGTSFEESSSRRATTFSGKQSLRNVQTQYQLPRRNKLITAVLGGELAQKIQRQNSAGRGKDEINIDVLLEGAEKLCSIYPIIGASEKIAALRHRQKMVQSSIDRYEVLVAEQAAQLERLSKSRNFGTHQSIDEMAHNVPGDNVTYTDEDMRRDEEGIRELEQKKRTLEERVSGMEKDLGGLMR